MPFGLVDNRRSLLFLGNLVNLIRLCLKHPTAAGKTYFISDGEDISTPELIRRLTKALGRSPRLAQVPPSLLKFAGLILGKGQEMNRLLGSLVVDSAAIRADLSWMPPFSLQEGLTTVSNWYFEQRSA